MCPHGDAAGDFFEVCAWCEGCTLEQIYWYHDKRKEYSEHNLFKAEFPGDDKEAFVSSMDQLLP